MQDNIVVLKNGSVRIDFTDQIVKLKGVSLADSARLYGYLSAASEKSAVLDFVIEAEGLEASIGQDIEDGFRRPRFSRYWHKDLPSLADRIYRRTEGVSLFLSTGTVNAFGIQGYPSMSLEVWVNIPRRTYIMYSLWSDSWYSTEIEENFLRYIKVENPDFLERLQQRDAERILFAAKQARNREYMNVGIGLV